MANMEPMNYLTAPLREVAQHHLKPHETVLMAIYAHHTVLYTRERWLWFTSYRPLHHPTRGFVLTTQRALIVDDPTDPATSSADHEYLFASCSPEQVMLFEHDLLHSLTCLQFRESSGFRTNNGIRRLTHSE